MKTAFLQLFLSLLISSISIAQFPEPLVVTNEKLDSDTDEWLYQSSTKYSYNKKGDQHNRMEYFRDENGNPYLYRQYDRILNLHGKSILSKSRVFNPDLGELELEVVRDFDYNANGQLIRTEVTRPEKSKYVVDNVYDNNNCLIEHKISTSAYSGTSFEPFTIHTQEIHKNNADCLPVRIENLIGANINDIVEFVYNSNGKLITKTFSEFDPIKDEFEINRTVEFEYDSQGRVIKKMKSNLLNGNVIKIINEYYEYEDNDPRFIYYLQEVLEDGFNEPSFEDEQFFMITPNGEKLKTADRRDDFEFSSFERDFTYIFDDQDNVVEKVESIDYYLYNNFDRRLVHEHEYVRRCDGLLLEEVVVNTEHYSSDNSPLELEATTRKIYEYGQPPDCESQLSNFQISAFPNPTKGIINIQSELLYYPETELRIFAANGALVNSEDAWISENYVVRLPDLPNGVYILQLFNKKLEERLNVSIVIVN